METLGDVDYLQIELSDALSRRCELESEIHQLVQSVSQGPSGALSVLPIELLVEILRLTLQDNPVEIHRLPLVCRAWSLVIQETPQLWTNIRITVPLDSNLVKKCAAYCSTVVKRSARYPLDISIDYSKFEMVSMSLAKLIEAKAEELFKPPEILKWFIFKRVGGNDPLDKYYVDCYLEPLKALSGDNFLGLTRWRSFELLSGRLLHMMSVLDAASTANIFAGSTPFLESLKLSYPSNFIVGEEGRNWVSSWEKSMPRPFPFSPNIHKIVLSNVFMHISIHSIDPLKLKRLHIHCCDTEQFQFILRCQNLTYLYMGCVLSATEGILRSLAPRALLFSRLIHLDLATSVPQWFFNSIMAPHLDSISFVDHDAFKAIKGMTLPASVTKVECRWPFRYRIREILMAGLSAVVQSPSVTTVICSVRYRSEAEIVLKHLSSTGFKSPTLSTLVILPFHNSSESEVLDTVDLQQLLY